MTSVLFHSYLDESIPYYGGIGNGASRHYNPPIDSVLTVWSVINGCIQLSDTLYHEAGQYLLREWGGCQNKANILCYVTYDGGHSWPGGKKGHALADPPSRKINASDLIWKFFQLHPLPNTTPVVETEKRSLTNFSLFQNYPNPFNPETTIRFDVKERVRVVLKIYDILGRQVKTLANTTYDPGQHKVVFDANRFVSGLYFYKIEMGEFQAMKKMLLLK